MDEATYNKTLAENEGLLRTIVRAGGFSGADEDDLVQQIKLNFWVTRNRRRASESHKAYLIGVARKTVAMALRHGNALMRDAPCFGFEERDTAEFSSGTINGKEIFKSADQERLADQKRLSEDLVALAGMMRPSHERVALNRLKADGEKSAPPTAVNRIGMLRESRRLLNLPEDNPTRAEITNPAAHLARVVKDAGRRRPAARTSAINQSRPMKKQEKPCATANSPTIIRKADDAKTQVQAPTFDLSTETSSVPSFSMSNGRRGTSTAASRSFDRKHSSASSPRKSDCGSLKRSTNACVPSRHPAGGRSETSPTISRRLGSTSRATTPGSTNAPQTTAPRRGPTRSGR